MFVDHSTLGINYSSVLEAAHFLILFIVPELWRALRTRTRGEGRNPTSTEGSLNVNAISLKISPLPFETYAPVLVLWKRKLSSDF